MDSFNLDELHQKLTKAKTKLTPDEGYCELTSINCPYDPWQNKCYDTELASVLSQYNHNQDPRWLPENQVLSDKIAKDAKPWLFFYDGKPTIFYNGQDIKDLPQRQEPKAGFTEWPKLEMFFQQKGLQTYNTLFAHSHYYSHWHQVAYLAHKSNFQQRDHYYSAQTDVLSEALVHQFNPQLIKKLHTARDFELRPLSAKLYLRVHLTALRLSKALNINYDDDRRLQRMAACYRSLGEDKQQLAKAINESSAYAKFILNPKNKLQLKEKHDPKRQKQDRELKRFNQHQRYRDRYRLGIHW